MAVYPDKSKPTPEGAYTAGTVPGLQDVTEASIRAQIRGRNLSPWERLNARVAQGFKAFTAGIVNLFAGAMLGTWKEIRPEDISIEDGQIKLNGRTDLLDGVRGYASAYQTLNVRTEKGYIFSGGQKWRFLPFNGQLGPVKGATVDPAGGIVLQETGLWTVYATVTKTEMGGIGALSIDQVDVHLFVCEDKWTSNDPPPSNKLLRSMKATDMTIIGGNQTATVVFSVVVDRPGVFVGVRAAATSDTWFLGGTLYSNLFVVKHDNRAIKPGEQTVPNE
ncbi:hypothetical protein ACN4D5_06565 [Corynebacterium macclintockiae]|uniref:hypothetical protein n=1 Tax=Corynebacterium macclintockiae TaxID=2913501 RepID=UPI003EBE517E